METLISILLAAISVLPFAVLILCLYAYFLCGKEMKEAIDDFNDSMEGIGIWRQLNPVVKKRKS